MAASSTHSTERCILKEMQEEGREIRKMRLLPLVCDSLSTKEGSELMENSFREFKRVSQQDKRDDVINIIIIKFHVVRAVAGANIAINGVPVDKIVCVKAFLSHGQ